MPGGKWNQEFDPKVESFENYVERLGHYFVANGVEDTLKKATFLSRCGPAAYDTLKNLCHPETPDTLSYREIIKRLKEHYKPAPMLIFERYQFSKCSRLEGEKISDFAVRLRKLSTTCQFGDFWESALCMQFVVGLNMPKAQDKLLQERLLTLNKAVGMAQTVESASSTFAQLEKATASSSGASGTAEVNKISRGYAKKKKDQKDSRNSQTYKDCWRCGKSDHHHRACFYKTRKCHECRKFGHAQWKCADVKSYNEKKNKTKSKKSVAAVDCADIESDSDSDLPIYAMKNIQNDETDSEDDYDCYTLYSVFCEMSEDALNDDTLKTCVDNDDSVLNVDANCMSTVDCHDVDVNMLNFDCQDVDMNMLNVDCQDVEVNMSDVDFHVSNVKQSDDHSVEVISQEDLESDCNDLLLCQVDSGVAGDPYYATVKVNGMKIKFEIDTAAAVSVISEQLYNKFWSSKSLRKPSAVLKGYSGTKLDVVGEFDAQIDYQGQSVSSVLRVIKGNRPALFGRDLLRCLKLDWQNIFAIRNDSRLDSILDRYKCVFSDKPGSITGYEADIPVDREVLPIFRKAYPVPFPLQAQVRKQLQEGIDRGVYVPVSKSEWASPQVTIVKDNGSLRLCGDYKVTVNQALEKDPYPLPTVEELLAKLGDGQIFSKIDLREAFQQLKLSEKSKSLLTVNSIIGLLQYERMPYGIKTAPQVFQKVMDKMLAGLNNVVCYIDDILIWSQDREQHYAVLENVLRTLQEHNVRARLSKCTFMENSIEYLGHKIDQKGIHPSEEKVKSLKLAPVPTNVSELKAFLGLVNFHGKFMKNLSSLLHPLNYLLRKDVKWRWCQRCQFAFDECKRLISADSCLVAYDVRRQLKLSCDASAYGVGAVLSHVMDDGSERPIAMASRTLSVAEKGYSQLEKEALSLIFGVKKFHRYIYGKKVTLVTDHKPLAVILGPKTGIPTLAAARLQRWSLILSAYDYDIEYRKGSEHSNADGLSRLPDPTESVPKVSVKCVTLDSLPVDSEMIQKALKEDSTLVKVYDYVLHGWPAHVNDPELDPYFRKRHELSIESGCLLWGFRVVIPTSLRNMLLQELHAEHLGIVSMKRLARGYLWWPGLDNCLEELALSCDVCQSMRNNPAQVPLHPWVYPSTVWERIHIDFAEKDKQFFLILVDSHSKWIEVFPMKNCTTAEKTIDVLRACFARYGLPQVLVSDNGPQFTSTAFQTFMKMNGIVHKLVPPYHPSSNGAAERTVQIVKRALEKIVKDKKVGGLLKDISQFLFKYRITPQSTTGKSPAELFLKRVPRSRLSLLKPSLARYVENKQNDQVRYHKSSKVREFKIGDKVQVRNYRGTEKWANGNVVKRCGPLTYLVDIGTHQRFVHVDQLVLLRNQSSSGFGFDVGFGTDSFHVTQQLDDRKYQAPEIGDIADSSVHDTVSVTNPVQVTSEVAPSVTGEVPEQNTTVSVTPKPVHNSPVVRRNPVRNRRAPTRLDL